MTSPSRLDRIYGWQRHIYDWTRPLFLPGRDRLLDAIDAPDDALVLEIGCGTGRNLVRLARTHPSWRLFGLDLSASMLQTARARIPEAMRGRIRLARGDADDWTPAALFGSDLRFHAVFFSYSLSMVSEPARALGRAAATLAPGGALHVVDFGGRETLRAPWSWFLPAWLRLWEVRPVSGLRALVEGAAREDRGGVRDDGTAGIEVRQRAICRGYAVLLCSARSGPPEPGSVTPPALPAPTASPSSPPGPAS